MSDLWTEASYDAEADQMAMLVTSARVSAAPMWGFLAAAESEGDFSNRKAIVADRLDQIVSTITLNDPVGFGVVRSSLEAALDEDFQVIHAERRREAAAEAQTRARVASETKRRQAEARYREAKKVTAAVICPYCDFTGSYDQVGAHIESEGPAHQANGSVTDQLNDKINRGASRKTAGPGSLIHWFVNKHTGDRRGMVDCVPTAGQVYVETAAHPELVVRQPGGIDGETGFSIDPIHWREDGRQGLDEYVSQKTSVRREADCADWPMVPHPNPFPGEEGHMIPSCPKCGGYALMIGSAPNDRFGPHESLRCKSCGFQEYLGSIASRKASRKIAVERKVELDPESGQYVGSEWEESEDGTSLVQSASTFGNNPKFATEEEANGWAAESAETEDTSKADAEPKDEPAEPEEDGKKANPFAKKDSSRRTASESGDYSEGLALGNRHRENGIDYNLPFGKNLDFVKGYKDGFDGTKKEAANQSCVDCGGTGSISTPAESGNVDDGYSPCPACKGTGLVTQASRRTASEVKSGDKVRATVSDDEIGTSGGEKFQGADLIVTEVEADGAIWAYNPNNAHGNENYLSAGQWEKVGSRRRTASEGNGFSVEKRGDKWVVTDDNGNTKGTHDTEEAAKKQKAAAYASWSQGKSGSRRTATWIDQARDVVTNHQSVEVGGILLDAQTANLLVQVYDALAPENRDKFGAMSLEKAADVAWKIQGKTSAKSDVCPKCGAKAEAVVTGDTLKASCTECDWTGSKKKTSGSRHPFDASAINSGGEQMALGAGSNPRVGHSAGGVPHQPPLEGRSVRQAGSGWAEDRGAQGGLGSGARSGPRRDGRSPSLPHAAMREAGAPDTQGSRPAQGGAHPRGRSLQQPQDSLPSAASVRGGEPRHQGGSPSVPNLREGSRAKGVDLGERTASNGALCADCFETVEGFDPDMGDDVTFEPGTCSKCGKDQAVFTVTSRRQAAAPNGNKAYAEYLARCKEMGLTALPKDRWQSARNVLDAAERKMKTALDANPYSTQGNPYIPAQPSPGTPDDLLDGPPNPAPVMLDVPMTTRPRQMPSGDSTPESTPERNDQ